MHTKNGWYFERAADGQVRIMVRSTEGDDRLLAEVKLSPAEWAGVMLEASGGTHTEDRREMALAFHNGETVEGMLVRKGRGDMTPDGRFQPRPDPTKSGGDELGRYKSAEDEPLPSSGDVKIRHDREAAALERENQGHRAR